MSVTRNLELRYARGEIELDELEALTEEALRYETVPDVDVGTDRPPQRIVRPTVFLFNERDEVVMLTSMGSAWHLQDDGFWTNSERVEFGLSSRPAFQVVRFELWAPTFRIGFGELNQAVNPYDNVQFPPYAMRICARA